MKGSVKGYKRYLFFAAMVVMLAVVAISSIENTEANHVAAEKQVLNNNQG